MHRTWFPSSRESGSFLRYDAKPNNYSRERGASPRDKTWATVIECVLVGSIVLIFIIKVIL
jgi:hypothetical protein